MEINHTCGKSLIDQQAGSSTEPHLRVTVGTQCLHLHSCPSAQVLLQKDYRNKFTLCILAEFGVAPAACLCQLTQESVLLPQKAAFNSWSQLWEARKEEGTPAGGNRLKNERMFSPWAHQTPLPRTNAHALASIDLHWLLPSVFLSAALDVKYYIIKCEFTHEHPHSSTQSLFNTTAQLITLSSASISAEQRGSN